MMMMCFNQITFIYFLWFFISIIYAFEVIGKNNFDYKWNGLPQLATFNNYEDMEKFIETSRKVDSLNNPLMDSYIAAYNLHHTDQSDHHIRKRSANPYDLIKFELTDAKEPDHETKALLKVHREREEKNLDLKRQEEDSTGPPIVRGNRTKSETTKSKITKRSGSDNPISNDDDDDLEISESRRTLNFYQPRLNSGIKAKKSIKNFPHEVQQAINLILNDNKQNNLISNTGLGLRYAPTHKQFYGDKIITNNNNYGGNYHKLQANINDKLKYIYVPTNQHQYNGGNDGAERYIAPYINIPSNNLNNDKQILSKTPSVIIGNGIAPAPISIDSHLSEISDVNTIIQPQNLVKIEPEINYVIQEVPPPTLLTEKLTAKPSISYKHYLSAPNILHNELLSKSVFTPSEIQYNDIKNKGFLQENSEQQHQEHISYENLGDYEKQIIKEHNLFNGVNEHKQNEQLTGKENNYNKVENDPYHSSSSSSSSSGGKFNILSSLIGKTPSEQLNGLTYLLENELINNKNVDEQQQKINIKRPQDNRAPILFHPDNKIGAGIVGQGKNIIINKYGFKEISGNDQQKDYKPITESTEEIHSHHVVHVTPSPIPPAVSTSYKHVHSIGLSPNYKNLDIEPKEYGFGADGKGLQYASKYAFGYRVRDFHTGNDFGHKQNRDHDGVTRGEYHILLPDGRVQNVRYHADDSGFHADVSFESGH